MTRDGLPRTWLLRAVLAVIVVHDLLVLFFFLADARQTALANGLPLNGFDALVSNPTARGIIVLIGILGAIGFAARPGRLWEGLLALVALGTLSTVHAHLFGSPFRHLFYSGLCLCGWLLGLAVTARRGALGDESYARIGSIALLGGAYLNAGISKLVFGGLDWLSGTPIQSVILGQDGLVADGIVSALRAWVVATPVVVAFCSAATVEFELAAPLMLTGKRNRIWIALGLFGMHATIYLLTGVILYWEAMALVMAFAWSQDEPSDRRAPAPSLRIRLDRRRFAGAAAFLSVCALLAIVHQARRAHPGPDAPDVPISAAQPSR